MSNVSGSNIDEIVECPLCMEPLEVDDLNFFPCTCGYQICRFCWHRIRTDENELCPACRKEYPENPADFKPLSQEEMIAFKFQKRQRDQQRKHKITENRKHLANVRVVQKNLVFVVGLPPRLADAEILRKHEYFGKYGKIHKVVINPSTTYAGVQGPSASAYVTYVLNTDALRAIQSVNNIMIDGRLIKTSLGTTKYCSHFMKNQQCPKGDCMYLHELGDPEASFTKEEMHQGKHQDYEKRLHELLVAGTFTSCSNANITSVVGTSISNSSCKTADNKGSGVTSGSSTNASLAGTNPAVNMSSPITVSEQQKEAWPCLMLSPVCQKESLSNVGNKRMKERYKQDKVKNDKISKSKNKNIVSHNNANNSSAVYKDADTNLERDKCFFSDFVAEKSRIDKNKDKVFNSTINFTIKAKEELLLNINKAQADTSEVCPNSDDNKITTSLYDVTVSENIDNHTPVPELQPTKISPNVYKSGIVEDKETSIDISKQFDENVDISTTSNDCSLIVHNGDTKSTKDILKTTFKINRNDEMDIRNIATNSSDILTDNSIYPDHRFLNDNTLGKDSLQETMGLNRTNIDPSVQNLNSGRNVPNLPDLINGIDGYQNNATCTNDWENAFKNVMLKTSKQVDNTYQQQHIQYKLEDNHQIKQIEDLRRLQDIQRRNAILNSIGTSQNMLTRNGAEVNRLPHYVEQQSDALQQPKPSERSIPTASFETNMSKFFDFHKHQQQKMQMQNVHNVTNGICGGLSENFQVMSLLENKLHSQLQDQNSLMSSQQQNFQNPKHCGKVDQMICYHQLPQMQNNHMVSSIHQSQLKNQYIQHSSADDDLGFDPFIETQKALAELIENEEEQQNATSSSQSKHATSRQLNYHQQTPIDHTLESVQGFRIPQMGFNHANNLGGYNISQRSQTNSKILPFVNISQNSIESCNHPIQQHQLASNVWGSNMSNVQQYASVPEIRREQFFQGGDNQKGYTGSDWTAMDPAILSYRQFAFPQHNQMGSQLQQPEQEMFLQQLTHHQQVFGQQSQQGGRSNIPNPVLNSHHNSQAQVAANVQGMLEYLKTRQCI